MNFFNLWALRVKPPFAAPQVLGEFRGRFFVDFFGPLSWQSPKQNSNQNWGASRPKSTLQGSGLDSRRKTYRSVVVNMQTDCIYYSTRSPETFCEFFFRICLGILH